MKKKELKKKVSISGSLEFCRTVAEFLWHCWRKGGASQDAPRAQWSWIPVSWLLVDPRINSLSSKLFPIYNLAIHWGFLHYEGMWWSYFLKNSDLYCFCCHRFESGAWFCLLQQSQRLGPRDISGSERLRFRWGDFCPRKSAWSTKLFISLFWHRKSFRITKVLVGF